MRLAMIFIAILAAAIPGFGREISIGLDRLAVVAPPPNDMNTHNTLLAVHFTLPQILDSAQIVYAELVVPLDFSEIDIAGSIEFRALPIIHDWTPQSNWQNPWATPGEDLDALVSSYTYALNPENTLSSRIYLDLTGFIREIVSGSRHNFGIMISPLHLDDEVLHLPAGVIRQMRDSAVLRITYK